MFFIRRRRLPARPSVKRRIFASLCGLLFVVLLISAIAEIKIRPAIYGQARTQVRRMCIIAADEAANYAVTRSGLEYSDVVTVEKNDKNEVTAVKSDVAVLNALKTAVSEQIEENLGKVGKREISVPLGNLTNSSFLAGRGPEIKISLTLSTSTAAEIKSEFESVGINQTRHSIILSVRCEVEIIMMNKREIEEITLNVPVAETVIVGNVPDTYLNIEKT